MGCKVERRKVLSNGLGEKETENFTSATNSKLTMIRTLNQSYFVAGKVGIRCGPNHEKGRVAVKGFYGRREFIRISLR
jgi:hypothetical protein